MKKILTDVERAFWLKELLGRLEKMNQDKFMEYVNKDKNDLGALVRDGIGDAALANTVSKLKGRKAIINVLKEFRKKLEAKK